MILEYKNAKPQISDSVFLAPGCVVIGDVVIDEDSSIWFQTVVRGDVNSIRIGKRTNIQDLSMVHVTRAEAAKPASTTIGDDVVVGHRVVLHGCTIGNSCLIGMGSIVMDHVVVGENSIVGAGSLVTENTIIPAEHLALGRPAKVIRPLTPDEIKGIGKLSRHYCELAKNYKTSR